MENSFHIFDLMHRRKGRSSAKMLSRAIIEGDTDQVTQLLSMGYHNDDEDTEFVPLIEASKRDNLEIVQKLLVSGHKVSATERNRNKALHKCTSGKIAKVLILGGTEVDCQNDHNSTPLTLSSQYGEVSKVQVLLESGADVNLSDNDGDTAAHCAAGFKKLEVMKLLLTKNPDLSLKNRKGLTALDRAKRTGDDEMVSLIQQHLDKGSLHPEGNVFEDWSLHMDDLSSDPLHVSVFEMMKEHASDDFKKVEDDPKLKYFLMKNMDDLQRSRKQLSEALKSVERKPQPVATALAKLLPEKHLEKLRNAADVYSWDVDVTCVDHKFMIGANRKGLVLQHPVEMSAVSLETGRIYQVASIVYESVTILFDIFDIPCGHHPSQTFIEKLVEMIIGTSIPEYVDDFVRAWNSCREIPDGVGLILALLAQIAVNYPGVIFHVALYSFTQLSWFETIVLLVRVGVMIVALATGVEELSDVINELIYILTLFDSATRYVVKIAKYSHYLQIKC